MKHLQLRKIDKSSDTETNEMIIASNKGVETDMKKEYEYERCYGDRRNRIWSEIKFKGCLKY